MMKRTISLLLIAVTILVLPLQMTAAYSGVSNNSEPVRTALVEELRETNSDTYLLSDGRYECVVYAEDKYYKDGNGNFAEIDHGIVKAQQTRSGKRYDYKNAAGGVDVYFSSNTPSVYIEANGKSIAFSMLEARCINGANPGGSSEKRSVSAYALYGENFIAYENVLADTDVIYRMTNGSLKEYILLKTPSAPSEFAFLFDAKDLIARKTEAGIIEFASPSGEEVFELGSLFAVDSNGEYTEALEYTVEETGKTGEYRITVSLSADYLKAPERAFPVLVDPSVNIYGASETYDCFVSNKVGCSNNNYCNEKLLRVGKCSAFGLCRTYISFKLPSSVIGATVTEGYIRLKKNSGSPSYVRSYKVLESWTSKYLTWFNQPLYDNGHTSGGLVLDTNDWYKIALNTLVNEWCQNPNRNYGIVLCSSDETAANKYAEFRSSEYGKPNRPELHIVYTEPIEDNCVYMIKNVSYNDYLSGTYLSATVGAFNLKSKNPKDGRQLWYVVHTGTGYRLYAMGHRNVPSKGANESLLQGAAPGERPNFTDYNGTNTCWTLKKVGSYYHIMNSWPGCENTLLTANSANKKVLMADSANASSYARWQFEKVEKATFNNYWPGTYYINGKKVEKGDPIHIKVSLQESGPNSVYTGSVIKKSYFNVVKQWNGLCSNITVYGPDDPVPSGVNALQVHYQGTTDSEVDFAGITRGQWNNANVYPTENWQSVEITLNLSANDDSLNDMEDYEIEAVILHEFGHALKLAHPKQKDDLDTTVPNGRGGYADDDKVCSIMNHGNLGFTGNLFCRRPKWHDRINLKNKWN